MAGPRDRGAFVAGEWMETGDWIDVLSPYSGETVGRVAKCGAAGGGRALGAAVAAFAEPLPAHRRAAILDAVAAALDARRDEAAGIICAEAGKPLKTARVEAERAASTY